ncbi:AEC family transporter [Aporhodopirellula aestuarii]|uniref:AEC family transporter n=1 Tax=Aporhodopirellula aestuarii TaxID=2950107 RepID=A0ABT0U723_9BACT|nr:AEC family transporter [Aporhodopirellula aestuarii]MCM2372705.1 AEC family transporter [Aporhodopirellula aestuarii]
MATAVAGMPARMIHGAIDCRILGSLAWTTLASTDLADASSWVRFGQIVSSVLGVFLIIGVGAFCRSRKWLSAEADFSLAKITANVLMPALFLDRILNDETLNSISTAWLPPVLGFGFTVVGMLTAWSAAKVLGRWISLVTDKQQRAFALCAGICNYGYIPLPLAQIFYPSAEVDLILHNVGVDMAMWSVGIAIISGGNGTKKVKAAPGLKSKLSRWVGMTLPALTSAPILAAAIAVAIRVLGWDTFVPNSLMKTIGILAAASIPMGLLLSGAIIIDFLKASQWTGATPLIFFSIGLRQLLLPVAMLGFAGLVLTQTDLKQVLLLQAAMPSAVFPVVLTRLYHGDTTTALRVVLSTSIAGLFLIPLWMSFGGWWLGV